LTSSSRPGPPRAGQATPMERLTGASQP